MASSRSSSLPTLAGRTLSAPARTPATDGAWRALHQAATEPYRQAGNFAWHFARGKLGRDPVFRGLLEHGLLPAQGHVVDIGSGQSLIASLMAAIEAAHARGDWPADWPAPPLGNRYTGIELMPKDVARAEASLAGLPRRPTLVCGDMREVPLPPCEAVVILDVLHYVDHGAQAALLQRVAQALAPGGRLLLRVGDADSRRGFAISQWVDRIVTMIRGHRVPPTYGRPLRAWIALLQQQGFQVQALPMSEGTPFANVLLVAERPHPA